MPTPTADAKIRNLTDQFVTELTVVIRKSALEAIQGALGGTGTSGARRGPAPSQSGSAATQSKSGARRKKIRKGGRRSSQDVEAMAGDIHAFVQANPGLGAIDIASALGVTSKDLALPIKKLHSENKVRTEGRRRGTRYFAGSGGGGGAKRKTSKKKA